MMRVIKAPRQQPFGECPTGQAVSYHPKPWVRWDPALSSCFRGPVLLLLRPKGVCPPRAHPAPSALALGTGDFRVPYLDYAELPSKNGTWALSPALSLAKHPQECASLGLRLATAQLSVWFVVWDLPAAWDVHTCAHETSSGAGQSPGWKRRGLGQGPWEMLRRLG